MNARPPIPPLFPYPTLFRSRKIVAALDRLEPDRARHIAIFAYILSRVARSGRSEEHTSELQSRLHLVCRLLLEKKNELPRMHSYKEATGAQCRVNFNRYINT